MPENNPPDISNSDDVDAKWLVKSNKCVYGFKVHMAVDDQNGFVLGGHVTGANVSDMNEIEKVVDGSGIKERSSVAADKGYASEKKR